MLDTDADTHMHTVNTEGKTASRKRPVNAPKRKKCRKRPTACLSPRRLTNSICPQAKSPQQSSSLATALQSTHVGALCSDVNSSLFFLLDRPSQPLHHNCLAGSDNFRVCMQNNLTCLLRLPSFSYRVTAGRSTALRPATSSHWGLITARSRCADGHRQQQHPRPPRLRVPLLPVWRWAIRS